MYCKIISPWLKALEGKFVFSHPPGYDAIEGLIQQSWIDDENLIKWMKVDDSAKGQINNEDITVVSDNEAEDAILSLSPLVMRLIRQDDKTVLTIESNMSGIAFDVYRSNSLPIGMTTPIGVISNTFQDDEDPYPDETFYYVAKHGNVLSNEVSHTTPIPPEIIEPEPKPEPEPIIDSAPIIN